MAAPMPPVQVVLQQQLALDLYLRNLLQALPDTIEDEDDAVGLSNPTPLQRELKRSEIKSPPIVEAVTVIKQTVKTLQPLALMPDWSRTEFQVLYFKIQDLILAAPLLSLSRTIKFDRNPTKIPTQPTWFLGLIDGHDQKIGVLDTGQLIHGKAKGAQRDLELQPFAYILVSADGKWGLACDEVLSVGKLSPEKVRWRTLRKIRPWLIGTVVNELTAVIDITQLVPAKK